MYDTERYRFERLLPDTINTAAPTFLVIGDTQSGWRAESKFYRRENWATWKQALFPFYQLYVLGNGIVGAVNYKRQVPDYDAHGRDAIRKALSKAAATSPPDFILHLGDMAFHDGRYPDHWKQFVDEYKYSDNPVLDEYPLLPVIGNHEVASDSAFGWPNYEAVFDYPRFYVQDMPNAALFVLDSNILIDQSHVIDDETQDALFHEWFVSADTSTEMSWLERELETRKDRPFKIVAMHHPPVSFSRHNGNWYEASFGRDLPAKRNALLGLLQEHGVQVMLSGHEHIYEHNLLHYRYAGGHQHIHLIISSGGGVPPRRVASEAEFNRRLQKLTESGLQVVPLKQVSVYHYSRVRITADTLFIDTYAVSEDNPEQVQLLDAVAVPARVSPSVQPAAAAK